MDDAGNQYTINIYTHFIPTPSSRNPTAEIEGAKELCTNTGVPVTKTGKGLYLIAQTRVVLRTDSPDAI